MIHQGKSSQRLRGFINGLTRCWVLPQCPAQCLMAGALATAALRFGLSAVRADVTDGCKFRTTCRADEYQRSTNSCAWQEQIGWRLSPGGTASSRRSAKRPAKRRTAICPNIRRETTVCPAGSRIDGEDFKAGKPARADAWRVRRAPRVPPPDTRDRILQAGRTWAITMRITAALPGC